MSVRRRQNFLGQQRVDIPHLKSIESAVSNDFDELIKGLVIGENKSYVVRGFEINMSGSINASASALQLIVENSAILHGASNESGTFYTIPTGTLAEPLNSTTNSRVQGAFTPSADNYIGIELVRSVDDTTSDQVNFWNPTSNVEFSKTVPLAIILDYKIIITTSSFADNVLPIAVVLTDSSNNVKSITDRRPLLYRLGTAGKNAPDPTYKYLWTDGREENFYTSTSSTSNPFIGGDKQISTMKDFFDALMTEFKAIKGTNFWYSQTPGSVLRMRQDIANTAFTGKGQVVHGAFDFQGTVSGLTTSVIIKTVNTNASSNITLTANSVDNINTLISNYNSANPNNQVYLYSGIGTQVPTANITLTSKAGQINWNENLYLNFIGGRLRYTIQSNPASADLSLLNNKVAYIQFVRGISVSPNLQFINGSNIVVSVGNASWTADLQAGDFIKDASKGDEFYYEIASVDNLYQVTLTTTYQEATTGSTGIDAQYAFGVYYTSPSPSTLRHVKIADRGSVPFGEDYFWLFYRQDDSGSVPKVYVRILGGQELQQGESQQISDNTSENILQYVGSTSESDIAPNYTNALGSARSNIHLIDSENLTKALKRLEQRNDIVPRVRAIDLVSTSLPTGASVTIDGETLINGNYVFFTNTLIEGLYKVSGVGTSVAFEKMYAFGGNQSPIDGDLVRVQAGTSYLRSIWKRVSGYWKPMEVADATKEPTGFPNRTDSVISFNNTTRTLSIAPSSAYFDIFSNGRVFRFNTAKTVTIPNTEGIYFFYFDTNGTLTYSTVFDLTILTQYIYVSNLYWSVSQAKAILVGDERHGITMDGATHEYLHNRNGAVVTSGGAINFASSPTGNSNSDAQITLSNIVFRDEDIRMDITNSASPVNPFEQTLDPIAKIPVFYRDGASGNWKKDNATNFPVKQGSSRIQYNLLSGGTWSQVDATEAYFVSMWVFATNNINEPVVTILGQNQYSSLSSAQAGDTYSSLNFGTMPAQEFKVLYRIIFQTSSAFTNSPKAMVVDVRDLRASVDTQFAQVAPNDHGLLSGLNDPDHGPTAVTTSGVTKDGGLSSSDTDLQQSLDTLNKLFGQLRLKEHPVNKKRVVITGANRLLNNGQSLIQSLKNLVLSFDGAEIDFSTGSIYKSDGVTALGVNFTPAVLPASRYFNYSVTITPYTINADNTISVQVTVTSASASNAVKASAPKATFAKGIQLGQVTVQENSGSINNITQADISQLGTGGGGSGGSGTSFDQVQAAHGFTLFTPIYHNGTQWVKAQANNSTTLATYVVTDYSTNTFTATNFGLIESSGHGLTVGEFYYVSSTVAGIITTTEPIIGYSNPVLYVQSTTNVHVMVHRPSVIGDGTVSDSEIGAIVAFPNAIEPTGFLYCDGRAVSRVTYSDLFGKIGTYYGSGDNSTTFNLPDLRGQFLRGGVEVLDKTFLPAAVDTVANTISITGHGFKHTGFKVRFTTTTTLPSPLIIDTDYFVIYVDDNTIKLATTLALANAGTATALTTQGTGTHTIKQWLDPDSSGRYSLQSGGSAGATFGSFQDDQLKSHTHSFTASVTNSSASGSGGTVGAGVSSSTTNSTGGNESRPKNMSVGFFIRYAAKGAIKGQDPLVEIIATAIRGATAAANGILYYRAPKTMKIEKAVLSLFTKGSATGTLTIDIKYNSTPNDVGMTTVLTTPLSINVTAASDFAEQTGSPNGSITITEGQWIRLDLTSVPTSMGDFYVSVYGR